MLWNTLSGHATSIFLKTRSSSLINKGHTANIYHHGRVYDGERLALRTLSLDDDPQLRQTQARDIIARLYSLDKVYEAPLIIKELRARIPLENTRVGQFLGMTSEDSHGTDQRAGD